jgi:hypothetical protein
VAQYPSAEVGNIRLRHIVTAPCCEAKFHERSVDQWIERAREQVVVINIFGAAGERLESTYIAGSTGNAGLIAFTKSLGAASQSNSQFKPLRLCSRCKLWAREDHQVSSKNSKANRIEIMKGPAESGEICSVEVEEK